MLSVFSVIFLPTNSENAPFLTPFITADFIQKSLHKLFICRMSYAVSEKRGCFLRL
jgi:hypothetical protein